jgi:protein SCO1/2
MRIARYVRSACLALAIAGAPALAGEDGHPDRPVGVDLNALLQLTTQRGTHLTRAELRGRPFIVLFGYTHCPEVCPTALFDLSTHLEKLGPDADPFGVVFVTVDPERDTVPVLREYLGSFDPRIIALTGTLADVTAVAEAFGAKFERKQGSDGAYTMNHSYMMFMVDKYGLMAKAVGYNEPEALAAYSRRLLAQ